MTINKSSFVSLIWADFYPDSSQVVQTGENTEGEKLKDLTNTFSVADYLWKELSESNYYLPK